MEIYLSLQCGPHCHRLPIVRTIIRPTITSTTNYNIFGIISDRKKQHSPVFQISQPYKPKSETRSKCHPMIRYTNRHANCSNHHTTNNYRSNNTDYSNHATILLQYRVVGIMTWKGTCGNGVNHVSTLPSSQESLSANNLVGRMHPLHQSLDSKKSLASSPPHDMGSNTFPQSSNGK